MIFARRADCTRIFVSVGYGFHVEMTYSEATEFASRKKDLLLKSVFFKLFYLILLSYSRQAGLRSVQASKIMSNIEAVMTYLSFL